MAVAGGICNTTLETERIEFYAHPGLLLRNLIVRMARLWKETFLKFCRLFHNMENWQFHYLYISCYDTKSELSLHKWFEQKSPALGLCKRFLRNSSHCQLTRKFWSVERSKSVYFIAKWYLIVICKLFTHDFVKLTIFQGGQ